MMNVTWNAFIVLTLFGLAMSMICVMAGGGKNGLYGAKLLDEGACRRTLQPCKAILTVTIYTLK